MFRYHLGSARRCPAKRSAWERYVRRNPGALDGALGVAAMATLTSWGTARLAQHINGTVLQVVFALYLAALGLGQALARSGETSVSPARVPTRLLPVVGLMGGGSMGLLGIGGGLVATPFFTSCFGLGQRVAQSLALALVTPSSAVALAIYAGHQRVDWPVGIALGLGGLFTVSGGVALAHAWPERVLRRAFGLMLIGTAAVLVIRRLA